MALNIDPRQPAAVSCDDPKRPAAVSYGEHVSEVSTTSGESCALSSYSPHVSLAVDTSVESSPSWSPRPRTPLGLRSRSALSNGTAYERSRFAAFERAAAFSRRAEAEERKIEEAAARKASIDAWDTMVTHRSAEAAQAMRDAGLQRVQEDSLARRAALALRGADYEERRKKYQSQVEADEVHAQRERIFEYNERASRRQQRLDSVAHGKALSHSARAIDSVQRRRLFEDRSAELEAAEERAQERLVKEMQLLGKIRC